MVVILAITKQPSQLLLALALWFACLITSGLVISLWGVYVRRAGPRQRTEKASGRTRATPQQELIVKADLFGRISAVSDKALTSRLIVVESNHQGKIIKDENE